MSRIALLVAIVALAGQAAAEPKIKRLSFVDAPADAENPLASRVVLRAVVGGAVPGLRPQDFVLRIDDVLIGATKSVPFGASDDELAILILVQGTVRLMGNEAEAIDGYHDVVKEAIDVVARARPRHTRVALYVYGDSVVARAPMGPAEAVSGDLLGAQAEYAAINTKALQRGLEEALRVLGAEPGRRVLFVIGDGGDQVEGYSVRADVERLAAASIEVYALGASPRDPSPVDRNRIGQLGRLGAHRFANQKEQVPQLAEVLMNEINSVYNVEFPEIQAADRQMMPTDGGEHDLVIKAGLEESDDRTLRFPGPLKCLLGTSVRCLCGGKPGSIGPPCPDEDDGGIPGWVWGAMIAGLAAGGAGVVLVMRRREEPEEEEAVPEPLPPPPPPAPEPPRVRKTVAIGALDDEAPPVVGWIVPIDGPMAFQTFRLKDDKTLIGAALDCDVRIEDPHMSKHHAEIAMLDGSFVLIDRGSRNGVKFLDRKVARHTLVDNDQFSLGGTSFKFKWTE